ncbi:unnamed protein product [Prorocentrum cordatum]|uniref:RRM domain-containing protein n=1 Tax=Prorocentrum cordatum TaxID=2364126 RepID=A0ABN9XT66_9DINO|nr:unnamed protein product [Polarella glacialis]
MAQTINISQIRGRQLSEIVRGLSREYGAAERWATAACEDGDDSASDSSTGVGSGSGGRASAHESSSSRDGADSGSEKDAARGAPDPWRHPVAFRPPPGLENLRPAPARTALRSSARPFQSAGAPAAAAAAREAPHRRPAEEGAVRTAPSQQREPPPRAAAEAEAKAEAEAAPHSGETMRAHLEELRGKGGGRTLVVRKIQRLGFDSPEKLKAHFEQYGAVEGVLINHSYVRSTGRRAKQAPATRVRPAHLGFVVMGSAAGAEAAASDGETHLVLGNAIEVQKFVPHHGEHPVRRINSEDSTEAGTDCTEDEQDTE